MIVGTLRFCPCIDTTPRVAGAGVFVVLLLMSAMCARALLGVNDSIHARGVVRKHFIGGGANVTYITGRGFPALARLFRGRNTNSVLTRASAHLRLEWVTRRSEPLGRCGFRGLHRRRCRSGPADFGPQLRRLCDRIRFRAYQEREFSIRVRLRGVHEYVGSAFTSIAFFISGPVIVGKQISPECRERERGGHQQRQSPDQHRVVCRQYPPPKGRRMGADTSTTVSQGAARRLTGPPCQTYRLKLASLMDGSDSRQRSLSQIRSFDAETPLRCGCAFATR